MKKQIVLTVVLLFCISVMLGCSAQMAHNNPAAFNNDYPANSQNKIEKTDSIETGNYCWGSNEKMVSAKPDDSLATEETLVVETVLEGNIKEATEPDPTYSVEHSEKDSQIKEHVDAKNKNIAEVDQNIGLQQHEGDNVIINTTPGTIPEEEILRGIIIWAEKEKGIDIKSQNFDFNILFSVEKAEQFVQNLSAVELTDGTIIGYVNYNEPANIKATKTGDVVCGTNYDFINEQIAQAAQHSSKDHYVHSGVNSAFFVISNNVKDFTNYFINCKEGNIPR